MEGNVVSHEAEYRLQTTQHDSTRKSTTRMIVAQSSRAKPPFHCWEVHQLLRVSASGGKFLNADCIVHLRRTMES